MMYFLWISSKMLALMTACRSVSMWSNVKYISRSFSARTTCHPSEFVTELLLRIY